MLVFGYVALTLLATYVLAAGILTLPLLEDLTGDLRSELRLALGFIAVLIFAVVLHVLYLPAKLDREQGELIE